MLDTPISAAPQSIGRVIAVNGSQSTIDLHARATTVENPTVGRFMGLMTLKSVIIGLITDVSEQPGIGAGQSFRKVAHLDLIGELISIQGAASAFPARRHRISEHRRQRGNAERARTAHGLRQRRRRPRPYRRPAAEIRTSASTSTSTI